MRSDPLRIKVGDVLYEASSDGKVIRWTVIEIFVEDYLSGGKTILVVYNYVHGKVERLMSEVMYWYKTPAEAEEFLEEE